MIVAPAASLKENVRRNKMELLARDRRIAFPRRPLIMGILNINDDSFSGDGRINTEWALDRARELISLGADLIDVGGESARTNRTAITPAEELRRILPFIEGFPAAGAAATPRDAEQVFPPLLSINTWRPEVTGPALETGGHLLNDMSALPDDRNARLCAKTGAALLIMHSVGEPKVPHTHVAYPDIRQTLCDFFRQKIALAENAGLPRASLILDPGIDFAKQTEDNLLIYRDLTALRAFDLPILLPVSRKSVIGRVLGITDPGERDAATAACIVAGLRRGASIFRVHNVEMAWRVIRAIRCVENDPLL
ncbi:MAG: dihydropteroate synthase [Verrucomicrobiota bacterium]